VAFAIASRTLSGILSLGGILFAFAFFDGDRNGGGGVFAAAASASACAEVGWATATSDIATSAADGLFIIIQKSNSIRAL